jgi:hypothetical protein
MKLPDLAVSRLRDVLQFRSPIKRFRTTPAMAAKVTERLWEVSDIVEVLETRERGEWVATRPNVV